MINALKRDGFEVLSQKGSHVKLQKMGPAGPQIVIVPMHSELKPGTLASILRQAGLSRDALKELL